MEPLHLQNTPTWVKGPLNQSNRNYIVFSHIEEVKKESSGRGIRFRLIGKLFRPELKVEIGNHYIKLEEIKNTKLSEKNFPELSITGVIECIAEDIVRIRWEPPQNRFPLNDEALFDEKEENQVYSPFKKNSPMLNQNFIIQDGLCQIENKEEIDKNDKSPWRIYTNRIIIELIESPFQIIIKEKDSEKSIIQSSICNLEWIPNGYGLSHGIIYSPDSEYTHISYFSFDQQITHPAEHFFGCGEDYGSLDKREKRIYLDTCDTTTTDTPQMYKPIPFFMSTAGYGIFINDSVPMVFDFGASFYGRTTIETLCDRMDIFLIIRPNFKEILNRYTDLTGKALKMPPKWSFGLWMSRISYKSEDEVRNVMREMRQHKIPCDVIHIDTDWFENEWECDFQWSAKKFPKPTKMIADAHKEGYRISIWQLPYINVKTQLYKEGLKAGVFADQPDEIELQAAVIDISKPNAREWYKNLIRPLLRQGVDVIKVDFGESAYPYYKYALEGVRMHNIYPLLYNKLQYEVSEEINNEKGDSPIIWARSAWAGSQRYPLHWAGDSKANFRSMFTTLRGGLSFGMSGFTFWSHDIGGFWPRPDPELYIRWSQFGLFSSHSRCHGAPPREPWTFGENAEKIFRKYSEMRYMLFPYIYTYGFISLKNGWPFLRSLLFEFQSALEFEPVLLQIEDQYMFGPSIMVAPIFKRGSNSRSVYFPGGYWYPLEVIFGEEDHYITDVYGDYPILGPCFKNIEYKTQSLEKIPIFIRGGSAIWCGPLFQHHTMRNTQVSELHLFPQQIQTLNSALDTVSDSTLDSKLLTWECPLYSKNNLILYRATWSGNKGDNPILNYVKEDEDKLKGGEKRTNYEINEKLIKSLKIFLH